MIWPDGSNFTQDIQNLQYLKPVSAFRTQYDYDNLLYIVAGEVIREASGLNWCGFCRRTQMMKPLEINHMPLLYV
jgi:CubicO group peptidase (beta-lactamase class C family)